MLKLLKLYLLFGLLSGCNNVSTEHSKADTASPIYPTVNYLAIKLDSAGHLPSNPYILEFKSENKSIVFCGVNHLTDYTDTGNTLFTKIETSFFKAKPDIAINEGGDMPAQKYTSKQESIRKDGEIGLTKYLCDSINIKTLDGDPPFALECKELLKKYSKGEVIAYITTERLMWGLKGHEITDSSKIKEAYNAFLQSYIITDGKVELTKEEQLFNFYTFNYQQLLGRPFNLTTLEPTNPFEPNSKFQEIGRTSKEIRDQFLLRTTDSQLNEYNKVFIVLGGWHLLTCRLGMEEIINRDRK